VFTSEEISTWLSRGWKHSDAEFPVVGISHDTRTLKAGEVYIAIRGENHDGHGFVEQAVEKGAAGLIVEREFPLDQRERGWSGATATERSGVANFEVPQLVVSNARKALWQIAAGARATWRGTVVGITGSAGKTTVKELTASVLAQKGAVSKTIGNWNNEIGLPLSMLAANRDSDFFVFEIGMSHPGEIDPLAALLRPDWAMITNIGKAHIEFFQSLEKIADEKAAILKHSKQAILDVDSEWFERLKANFSGSVVALTEENFTAPQPGAYMIQNARFAATLGLELGLSPDEIQTGLDSFQPPPMRWQIIKNDEGVFNGVVFINDAYNANPLSMREALKTFAELEGRKFAVLGGMRELGACSDQEHRDVRGLAESFGFDGVLLVGDQWDAGVEKSTAIQLLREILRPGDKVLLKASRGERLETIFDELK
jgi:UDP-N-acetylmuramoyl-tripeptide--D-alanyl-D-alanine ligase